MQQKTYIDLIKECDNFPYSEEASQQTMTRTYFDFRLAGHDSCLGFVLPHIAGKFLPSEVLDVDTEAKTVTFTPFAVSSDSDQPAQQRTEVLAKYLQTVREAKIFKVLDGWRDELYPVYGTNQQLLFSMERSAAALFGIITYGIHMTAYTENQGELRLWTPRRSPTKQTYPGMMDNTVAGGLSTGERPFECLLREAMEEASLPAEVVRHAKVCGTMTYFYVRDERAGGEVGLCQPECQYVYDLVLPSDVIPVPGDNEAIDFQLLTVDEVKAALAAGRFKPNCAMLLVDFFIRHGIITPESEPDYIEVVSRLHRRLPFPMA